MFKRTIVSGLIATSVAAATLAGTVQPSAAHGHHHHREIGIGIAAGVGGFVLGSLLA
ncbi:MAG: BA14K family protein, partial [Mesorhizobium sp.]